MNDEITAECNRVLDTWLGLNSRLLTADQAFCARLLVLELAGRKRIQVMLRIHGRLNRVRAAVERINIRRAANG